MDHQTLLQEAKHELNLKTPSLQTVTLDEIWDALETMAPHSAPYLSESEFLARFQVLVQFDRDGYLVIPDFFDPTKMRSQASQLLSDFDISNHPLTKFTTGDNQTSDEYFLTSGDKIRYFFEEGALSDDNVLLTDKEKAINKIGHALHELDPVFKEFSTSEKVVDVARSLNYKDARVLQKVPLLKRFIRNKTNDGTLNVKMNEGQEPDDSEYIAAPVTSVPIFQEKLDESVNQIKSLELKLSNQHQEKKELAVSNQKITNLQVSLYSARAEAEKVPALQEQLHHSNNQITSLQLSMGSLKRELKNVNLYSNLLKENSVSLEMKLQTSLEDQMNKMDGMQLKYQEELNEKDNAFEILNAKYLKIKADLELSLKSLSEKDSLISDLKNQIVSHQNSYNELAENYELTKCDQSEHMKLSNVLKEKLSQVEKELESKLSEQEHQLKQWKVEYKELNLTIESKTKEITHLENTYSNAIMGLQEALNHEKSSSENFKAEKFVSDQNFVNEIEKIRDVVDGLNGAFIYLIPKII
ncbi:hypothetical protein HDV02_000964 [Globomyces sp. JEL0801]|nr:hypothetical protein HDV02_000964 [Globomyces sp. JEL0801]